MNKEIKKGDRLKVRDDLIVDETYGDFSFTQTMSKYKGEVVTIDKLYDINKGVYQIKEDGGLSGWTKSMFEFIVSDNVNSPSHYTQGQYETIDVIEDIVEDVPSYLLGNIIKYVSRYKNKNGVQDLEKAEWYLKRLIKKEKEND